MIAEIFCNTCNLKNGANMDLSAPNEIIGLMLVDKISSIRRWRKDKL